MLYPLVEIGTPLIYNGRNIVPSTVDTYLYCEQYEWLLALLALLALYILSLMVLALYIWLYCTKDLVVLA